MISRSILEDKENTWINNWMMALWITIHLFLLNHLIIKGKIRLKPLQAENLIQVMSIDILAMLNTIF